MGIVRSAGRDFRLDAIGWPPLCTLYQGNVPALGHLFEERFKSSLVDSVCDLLSCMRYIELNPVRAGMVDNPGQYPWSSFRAHLGESVIDWLSESEKYRRLAATPEAHKLTYRDLFNQPPATRDIESIRMHLNKDRSGLKPISG